MEKLKIAILKDGIDATNDELFRSICEDPVMSDLCIPAVYNGGEQEVALRDLDKGLVDALVFTSPKRPTASTEIIVTDKTNLMPLAKEPTAEDIVKLRDILERDFDLRSPRIAIVLEGNMQNPEFATQVTVEQNISTYGPYTVEQLLTGDAACHFDGIIIVGDTAMEQRIVSALSQEAPIRYYAGMESVFTAVYHPIHMEEIGDGLADVTELTHPIYIATDIIRNRSFYDEARQNILPKLFHDKRDDRKKGDNTNNNNDNTEKPS